MINVRKIRIEIPHYETWSDGVTRLVNNVMAEYPNGRLVNAQLVGLDEIMLVIDDQEE